MREPAEFAASEWASAWGVTREVSDRAGGAINIPAPPWHFGARDGSPAPQVPALQGGHNAELLKELGYPDEQIEALVHGAALVEPARLTP